MPNFCVEQTKCLAICKPAFTALSFCKIRMEQCIYNEIENQKDFRMNCMAHACVTTKNLKVNPVYGQV